MSKELIKRLREHAKDFFGGAGGLQSALLEAADALEAKAAPVGEREDERAAIHQLAFELGGTEGGEYWLDASDLDKVIDATYQRAQQPQSAEAVAYVLTRDGEICYEADDGIVISNTPGDETDLYKWQPVYFTTPQPSAGVVIPERVDPESINKILTALQLNGWVNTWHAAQIWNACLDEFASLNGKEVV